MRDHQHVARVQLDALGQLRRQIVAGADLGQAGDGVDAEVAQALAGAGAGSAPMRPSWESAPRV